jgi:hypothetical protein
MVLKQDLLNVFSEEGLMVAYPGKENLPLARKFENLRAIFEGYNVQVVVTLRDPVDYLYSLYVQLYPDFFINIKHLNSVQKYVDHFISHPDDVLFESLFHSKFLSELQNNFDVIVFQYEQLSAKKLSAYQSWAYLLDIPCDKFISLFNAKKVNEKKKSGKESKKTWDLKGVERKLKQLFSVSSLGFKWAKFVYNKSGLRILLSYRFSSTNTHQYPQGEQYKNLQLMLSDKEK